MSSILLQNASVRIPVFDYSARKLIRSLRSRSIDNLALSNQKTFDALSDISLDVCRGERLGVIGANGAGKTTLLRLLAGVYAPSTGTVMVAGQVTSLLDITFGIEPDLTGRESIFLRARILGLSKKAVSKRLEEIISFSGLGEFIDLPTRTYSSGMFVRLAFAIATILDPEILIMDEWLSVGDESFKHKAEARLLAMVEETDILVLASHSQELIEKVCSRVIWLDNGRLRMDGTAAEVCEAYFDSDI